MSNRIKLRRTTVSGRTGLAANLQHGEVAINTEDGKIWVGQTNGDVVELGSNVDHLHVQTHIGFTGNSTFDLGTAEMGWNFDEDTLDVKVSENVTLQVGQEFLYNVRNLTGNTIPDGVPVRAVGTIGNSGRILIAPYWANTELFDHKYLLGVTTEAIADGADGKVTKDGKVRGLDLRTFNEGEVVYITDVEPSTPSNFLEYWTTTRPTAPNHKHAAAFVVSNTNNGTLVVRAKIGSDLGDLHNVDTNGSKSEKDMIVYDTATQRWEKQNLLTEIIGYETYAAYVGDEPNGFVNNDQVTFSFDANTRTIDLAGEFVFMSKGLKYTGNNESIQISNTEGLHAIYFDGNGAIQSTTLIPAEIDNIIERYCFACAIYWDADNQRAIPWIINETHGYSMSAVTHHYLHRTRGTQYYSGMALTLGEVGGSATNNAEAQFVATAGVMFDEDITHNVQARSDLAATIPLLWREGENGDWRMDDTQSFVVTNEGSGTLRYNQNLGGNTGWQLTAAASNQYVLSHIYAIPGPNPNEAGYIALVGQNVYSTVPLARAGILTEALELDLAGLPFVEGVLVASCISQTRSDYTNQTQSRFVNVDTSGATIIDWRNDQPTAITSTVGTTSWGGITGTITNQADLVSYIAAQIAAAAGGGITWVKVTDDTQANVDYGYLVDASANAVTLTMPASPSEGDVVGVSDAYEVSVTNNITLDGNGENFEQSNTDLIIDVAGATFELIYVDTTVGWKVKNL